MTIKYCSTGFFNPRIGRLAFKIDGDGEEDDDDDADDALGLTYTRFRVWVLGACEMILLEFRKMDLLTCEDANTDDDDDEEDNDNEDDSNADDEEDDDDAEIAEKPRNEDRIILKKKLLDERQNISNLTLLFTYTIFCWIKLYCIYIYIYLEKYKYIYGGCQEKVVSMT